MRCRRDLDEGRLVGLPRVTAARARLAQEQQIANFKEGKGEEQSVHDCGTENRHRKSAQKTGT